MICSADYLVAYTNAIQLLNQMRRERNNTLSGFCLYFYCKYRAAEHATYKVPCYINHQSTPFCTCIPASKACLIDCTSLTVSAISIKVRWAARPVITTCWVAGLLFSAFT